MEPLAGMLSRDCSTIDGLRDFFLLHRHLYGIVQDSFWKQVLAYISGSSTAPSTLVSTCSGLQLAVGGIGSCIFLHTPSTVGPVYFQMF